MKKRIYVLLLLLASSSVFAQNKKTIKIGNEVKEKIESTPVGFYKKGKTTVNQQVLNPKTCTEEKIASFEIVKSKKSNNFFLIRKSKLENGFLTIIIKLKLSGDKLLINLNAENFMAGCFSTTCNSCGEEISGTGSAFCECAGGDGSTGDCTEYDHCPESQVLSTLFL